MAQKLFDDKITTLSHNAGIITMASGARVTIGGQQYVTTSATNRTIATDLTMASSSLYMVFAVLNGGNVELRISANVNSVGPSGFVAWKLVGAFYSDGTGSPAFGSFVNIDGMPVSGGITYTPTIQGFTGSTFNTVIFSRIGDRMKGMVRMGNGSASATEFRFGFPGSLVPSSILSSGLNHNIGKYNLNAVNNAADEYVLITQAGQAYMNVGEQRSNSGLTAVTTAVIAGGLPASFFWEVPIQGWSNTPLKDL